MIELVLNGVSIDLSGNEDFALSFAASKLQEIESRSGDFSTTFQIPLTGGVKQALGHINRIDSASELPYQELTAQVYDNSVLVFNGFSRIVRVTDTIELSIYAGNSNWINLIKDKQLTDLDFSSLNFVMNATNIQARRLNTSNLIYANAFYGEFADPSNPFTFYDFFPSLYNLAILNKIFSSIGWNIDGDLLTDSLFTKSVLPFSNDKLGNDNVLFGQSGLMLDAYLALVGTNTGFVGLDIATINTIDSLFLANETGLITSAASFTIEETNNYTIQGFYLFTISTIGTTFTYELWNKDTNTLITGLGSTEVTSTGTNATGFLNTLKLNPGVYSIKVSVNYTGGFGSSSTRFFRITGLDNFSYKKNVVEGQVVNISKSLPDITQAEFIKTIVNQFNVIIESDYITKTVSFNKFESIKNNKSIALDWTEKVDLSETAEINFTPENYGQTNYFTYEQDENDSYQTNLTIGDGSFAISNTQLDLEKDLVKLPFAASVRNFIDSVELMVLPIRLDSIKPRIAYIEITSNNIVTMVGQSTPTQSAELYFDELKFSNLLTNYYPYLISMLQRYRLVKILFNLKSIDLINIDYRKPIFVDFNCEVNGQVRGYFYLNLVDQFNGNSTTMCELIKLN